MSEKIYDLSACYSGRVLNFGSLNIDHVYKVSSFVQPGETVASLEYARFAGGKGANQSVALARAGSNVAHAGKIGPDASFMREMLQESGVNTEFVEEISMPSGHAVIQVDESGENSIILHGGANHAFDEAFLERVFESYGESDVLLTQNETNMVPEILEKAAEKKMLVVFNPAPMTCDVKSYPLEKIDILIINETEGMALTDCRNPVDIIAELTQLYPRMRVVLTLGGEGVIYGDSHENHISVNACNVDVVDTTAAGDTFIGYFLNSILSESDNIENALKNAAFAAGICVQREGAVESIPERSEF